MSISTALIGCGLAGSRHASALRRIDLGLALEAAFDTDPARAAAFQATHDVPAFGSLTELCDRRFDLIIICTPNEWHGPLIELALQCGAHVLVEHPLAINADAAVRLIEQANAHQRKLMVVRQHQYSPLAEPLKRALLEASTEGGTIRAQVLWNRDDAYFAARPWQTDPTWGGVMRNQASHFLNLLIHYLGEPLLRRVLRGNVRYEHPVEDTVVGEMRFGSSWDCRFLFTIACRNRHAESELLVNTDAGTIRLAGKAWNRIVEWTLGSQPCLGTAPADLHSLLLTDVARYLRNSPGPDLNLTAELATLRTGSVITAVAPLDPRRTLSLIKDWFPHTFEFLETRL